MDVWIPVLIAVVSGLLGSSGLWALVHNRNKTQTAMARLILGLAYDKVATLGMHYIERGWITRDEYEDYMNYLYQPYMDAGGNGVAAQIQQQVSNLPFKSHGRYAEIAQIGRGEREIA